MMIRLADGCTIEEFALKIGPDRHHLTYAQGIIDIFAEQGWVDERSGVIRSATPSDPKLSFARACLEPAPGHSVEVSELMGVARAWAIANLDPRRAPLLTRLKVFEVGRVVAEAHGGELRSLRVIDGVRFRADAPSPVPRGIKGHLPREMPDKTPMMLGRDEARSAIGKIMAEHPMLTRFGIGTFGNSRPKVSEPKFVSDRAEMLDDAACEEFRTSVAYLSLLARTSSAAIGSYGLKHSAEAWGGKNGMSSYVANGMLIAAAIHLGLKTRHESGSPNVSISVGKRSRERLDRAVHEIRV